ncbi:hypothetical protein PROFUN_00454 [Planoprotostelium fungivorum]|uniref:C-8 sterol isomerase n=1 Tax=Planoprotostelium fungivorum TaxID=1890364 RepID=A0A2P6N0Y5_9EUKA|nr:hypothetical protein PROFUN_00454 [Planoprotostelium fungivorum]
MISLLLVSWTIGCFIFAQIFFKLILDNFRFNAGNFVFDPKVLQGIATKHAADSTKTKEEVFDAVQQELAKTYPDHVWTRKQWVWLSSGGSVVSATFLHASLTEFLIFYGTPTPVSGHSGRQPLEAFDFVLRGEKCYQLENEIKLNRAKAGEMSYLPTMRSANLCIKDECWSLQYGRGLLPLALPFYLLSTFTSTLDFISLIRGIMICSSYTLYELFYNKKI